LGGIKEQQMELIMQNTNEKQNGYIVFHSYWNRDLPPLLFDVNEIINGKRNKIANITTSMKEPKIEKQPGIYNLELNNQTTINGITVKENHSTYVGLYGIIIMRITGAKACFSCGSIQIPMNIRTDDDIKLLYLGLNDEDWATRKMSIIALRNIDKIIPDDILIRIQYLSILDRMEAVRKEANNYLKSKQIAIPEAPFYFTGFTDLEAGWNWTGKEQKDPNYSVDIDGYHIKGSTFGYSAVWLKDLLINKGFFGFDPSKLVNYDIELESQFIDGKQDGGYGLLLGKSFKEYTINGIHEATAYSDNYYLFCISKNGGAAVCRVIGNQFEKNPIEWVQTAASSIISNKSSQLKIEIRGEIFNYYVNGISIGSLRTDNKFLSECIGIVITNPMHVCFPRLALYKRDK
jgi:hypothetical protein